MMRNTEMKQTIITIILALVTLTTTAQVNLETNNTPGWLWEVSGNGLKQKSYLFGTCHGDGHNFTREEVLGIAGVENALKEVKTVLFEGGMDTSDVDPTAIVAEVEKLKKWLINPGPEYLMPKGTYYKPLFDTIAHFNEVTKFLSYQMKDPEYWKKNPRYWLGRLRLYIGFKLKGTPVDVVLKQETINRGIEARYVEKRDSNMLLSMILNTEIIDTLPMKKQAESLYSIVHYINNDSLSDLYKQFAEIYLENDTCKMESFLRGTGFVPDAEASNDIHKEIIYDRNVAWIPVIKQNIAEHPSMIAVGCRHLLGSESLIALLRREGYTINPVKY
ncbi:MAG: TraB/GumN family protein [Prevotella sp.]|nr:TraB/GumN family protein [Prevotella sp.]